MMEPMVPAALGTHTHSQIGHASNKKEQNNLKARNNFVLRAVRSVFFAPKAPDVMDTAKDEEQAPATCPAEAKDSDMQPSGSKDTNSFRDVSDGKESKEQRRAERKAQVHEQKMEDADDEDQENPPSSSTENQPKIPDHHDTTAVIAAIATLLAAISNQNDETERMYYFLARSFQMAQWSPEANIAACVLILRWVQAGHTLCTQNWKQMLLTALLIAQKITDDVPLANREFCTIWQAVSEESILLTPNQVNQLEVSFLKDMDWHVFVDSGTMIEVYFELVSLAANEMNDNNNEAEAKQ